jgi:beta-lactamase regulating signal transducer with metallopeptidase domain
LARHKINRSETVTPNSPLLTRQEGLPDNIKSNDSKTTAISNSIPDQDTNKSKVEATSSPHDNESSTVTRGSIVSAGETQQILLQRPWPKAVPRLSGAGGESLKVNSPVETSVATSNNRTATLEETATTSVTATEADESNKDSIVSSVGIGTTLQLSLTGAVCLWIVIGCLRLLWLAGRHAQWLRTADKLTTGPARRIVDGLSHNHRIRKRIRLLSSSKCTDPAAFGLWRWTILLPAGIEGRLEQNQLQALLAHETAHLVRGDMRWLWLGRLLSHCFAWQPLNLVAVREWRRASEYLCDDWALERGVPAITLAKCLTQLAEWRLDKVASSAGLAAVGTQGTLFKRVERLLAAKRVADRWQNAQWKGLLTFVLLVVAGLLVYCGPRTSWAGLVPELSPVPMLHSANARRETNEKTAADDADIAAELELLTQYLLRAMQLLEKEDDPEIRCVVEDMRERLKIIKAQIERSVNKTNPDSYRGKNQ